MASLKSDSTDSRLSFYKTYRKESRAAKATRCSSASAKILLSLLHSIASQDMHPFLALNVDMVTPYASAEELCSRNKVKFAGDHPLHPHRNTCRAGYKTLAMVDSFPAYPASTMPFIMSPSTPAHPSTAPQEASPAAVEPAPSTVRPQCLSVPLSHIIHTTLHIQLTRYETSNMIFLTNTDPSSSPSTSPLGSFVYAMPNVCLHPPATMSSLRPMGIYTSHNIPTY